MLFTIELSISILVGRNLQILSYVNTWPERIGVGIINFEEWFELNYIVILALGALVD